jgi:hypothetical protein
MDAAVVHNGLRSVLLVLAVCGLVAGPAGCASDETSGAAIGAVQHPLLENFPLPPGFKMVADRSVARNSGTVRMAKCEFEGNLSTESTVGFYEEYMPTAQFRQLDKRFEAGTYALRFESSREECEIRVRRTRTKTVLVIDLGPLSQAAEPRHPSAPAE